MRREFHVRFCEGPGGKFPRSTRLAPAGPHRDGARTFAFVGAGLAGLALADRLASGPRGDRSVVLFDPVLPADDPRTFGCWAEGPSPLDPVAMRSWDRLGVGTTGGVRALALGPFRYLTFRMADWRRSRWQALDRPGVSWHRQTVETVEDSPWGAVLVVDGERIAARWVFDSRFSPSDLPAIEGDRHVLLWQSFRGEWIEVERDVFDPELPLWMDFRVEQPADGVAFGYVMPESPRRALVEIVRIGPEPTRADLEGYLRGPLGIEAWRTLRVEGGATPMTDRPFPRRIGNRVLRIGTAGGRIKPSTGYGLPRILADAEAVARSFEAHGHPFVLPRDRWLPARFDTVLLRVIRDEPGRMVEIFEALLANNPAPRVLRLLDERPGFSDLLGIIAGMPPGPFLRAMARCR